MLAHRDSGERKFIVLLRSVADVSDRQDKNPVSAVEAVLRTFDAASRIARGELYRRASRCCSTHYLGRRPSYLKALNHRRGVVHLKAFAFAFGLERESGRIRRCVVSDYFQVVSSIR